MEPIPELDRDELRKFGLLFGAIIGILFGAALPWVFSAGYPYWPWAVLVIFFVWSLAAPLTLRGFYRIWMRFGFVLNAVMSRIILGIVYYLAVLPTGVIRRLFSNDPLNRKLDKNIKTYRVNSEKQPPNQMEKPF